MPTENVNAGPKHIQHNKSVEAMMNHIVRLKQLYDEGGIDLVRRRSGQYFRRVVLRRPYFAKRKDNEERWRAIAKHIAPADKVLLDVGCADGWLSSRAADAGLFTIGVDYDEIYVNRARKRFDRPGLAFFQFDITPDTVESLPESDVCLFLTVHHHWVRDYGVNEAREMLNVLASKTNTLVYEPPGTKSVIERDREIDPAESLDYYIDHLPELFDSPVNLVHSQLVDYDGRLSSRHDPLLIIDTTNS